jgi:hypothetical protein
MMSRKTLLGEETRWADIFPRKETISGIFMDRPLAFNVLHYADYRDPMHTGSDLGDRLREVIDICGAGLGAIQLDMTWPEPVALFKIKAENPWLKLVLQIGAKAFSQISFNPLYFAQRLRRYEGCLDYVLLDQSMGHGEPLDARFLRDFMLALEGFDRSIGIVVAGGLGPGRLKSLAGLASRFSNLSWDAQGRLRPSRALADPVDWDMAEQYLRESCELLRSV